MGLRVIVPPTALLVSLAEAKQQLRILDNEQDAYITQLIHSVTAYVARALGMSLAQQTLNLSLDAFTDSIKLLRGPVTSVLNVDYFNQSGNLTAVPTNSYTVDLSGQTAWIVRNSAYAWPITANGVNAVSITYVAGYTQLPEQMQDLKLAIMIMVAQAFENRSSANAHEINNMLVDQFREIVL